MLSTDISKEEILYISQMVREAIPMEELKSGYELYRSGKVYNLNLKQSIIFATVLDDNPFSVSLDLDFFNMSTCSCSSDIHCKHLSALFFYVYSAFSHAGELFTQWQIAHASRQQAQKVRSKIETVTQSSPATPVLGPDPQSVQDWHRYYKEAFEQFENRQTTFRDIYKDYYKKKLASALPRNTEPTLKKLYDLHSLIDTTLRIIIFKGKSNYFYMHYMIEETLNSLFNEINSLLVHLQKSPILKDYEKHLKESIDVFHDLLLQENGYPEYRLLIYRLIWTRLLQQTSWIEMNKKRLSTINNGSLDYYVSKLCLAHMEFLLGNDEEAFHLIKDNKYLLDESLLCLHLIKEKEDWTRLYTWLQFFTPQVDLHDAEMVEHILSYWDLYGQITKKKEIAIHAGLQLLPASYPFLSNCLLETQRYKQWVELQIHFKFSPYVLSRDQLKMIEKEDVSLLLPLYHQSVEQLISEKNRDSYKAAVKLLKKLYSYYKRLKEVDAWERYITFLVTQHSRLSALKQELMKGKLIR